MKKRDFLLFLAASGILGISQSIDSSFFNNFLNDTFHLAVTQRTFLEIPREFPGVMVVFVSGILLFFGDVRIASIANIMAAFGIFGMAFFTKGYGTMIAWLTLYSMGQHLFMPVSNSIGMNLSDSGSMGRKLGQINGFNTAVFLAVSLLTAFISRNIKISYRFAFAAASTAFLTSAVLISFMTPHRQSKNAKRIILRKEYTLYYILSIVYGARKQIFITFGPWVLIKAFNQGVSTFAVLSFLVAGAGIFIKPLIGMLIDKKGEKFVLGAEALILIFICLGYTASKFLSSNLKYTALIIACICFVIDQVLVAAGMARATYLKKIALAPEDVSPTLSMGLSIDHIVSMFVPFMGGYIWMKYGYEYVFLAGALIAAVNFMLTRKIDTGKCVVSETQAESCC